MQADKVHLISYSRDDDAAKFFKQIVEHLENNYEHIKVEEVFLTSGIFTCASKSSAKSS